MEFGSKEWLEKVESIYKFPCILAYYVSNKKGSIMNAPVDTKSENIGNIKYSKLSPSVLLEDGEKLALISVETIHNAEEYLEKAKELKSDWKR